GLQIATKLSQPVYRPGETARMELSVTDGEGRPAPAALGIAAVDESVFALVENRSGSLGELLDPERENCRPRFQIGQFSSPLTLLRSGNQPLAAAYFASLDEPATGPTLGDLMRNEALPQRLIDHARALKGNPAYNRFRADPQYAAAFRLLEGTQGAY